jgi:hypothetical protein
MSRQLESHTRHAVTKTGLYAVTAAALMALASSGCGSAPAPHSEPARAVNVTVTAPPNAPKPRKRVTRTRVVYAAAPEPVAQSSGEPSCGAGLEIGPRTSCAFAENVRAAYAKHGPGTVMAHSPVTHKTYAMTCSAGATVVCSGGNGAWLSFAGATHVHTAGRAACGDGITVGPGTSCAFAANVRAAYESHGPGTVTAYSPVTRRTYPMSCSGAAPIVCTGGDNASMWFR